MNKYRRSLALHAAVIRELKIDPDRVLAIARNNLARWHNDGHVPPLRQEWVEIMDNGVAAVVNVLQAVDEHADQLRNASPFTGIISQKERAAIIANLEIKPDRSGS